jgi:hypothetical protein
VSAAEKLRHQLCILKNIDWWRSGTNVMIFKIFSPKNLAKKLAFLIGNKGKF